MTHNQIEYWKLKETERSNKVNESENKRHNQSVEGETQRHNIAQEGETNRHNLTTELIDMNKFYEQARSNRANEDIARERNSIARDTLSETIRSNKQRESLGWLSYNEDVRHNKATEANSVYNTTANTATKFFSSPGGSGKGKGIATTVSAGATAAVKAVSHFPLITTFKDLLEMQSNSLRPNSKKGSIAG